MKKAIIISGNLAQDHEFIYPYYRLLEADFEVDVCLLEGKPVKGILGTTLPPNKDQVVKIIDEIKVEDYKVLVLCCFFMFHKYPCFQLFFRSSKIIAFFSVVFSTFKNSLFFSFFLEVHK